MLSSAWIKYNWIHYNENRNNMQCSFPAVPHAFKHSSSFECCGGKWTHTIFILELQLNSHHSSASHRPVSVSRGLKCRAATWRAREGRMSDRHVRKAKLQISEASVCDFIEENPVFHWCLAYLLQLTLIWISSTETLFVSRGLNVPADGYCGYSLK